MTDIIEQIDLAKARRDPASVFAKPADVIGVASLSHHQKLDILQHWERDARAIAVADEEGMTGGEESMLSRVRRAIVALGGDEADEKSGATTKHG
jgi:hypothetical protein